MDVIKVSFNILSLRCCLSFFSCYSGKMPDLKKKLKEIRVCFGKSCDSLMIWHGGEDIVSAGDITC